MRRVLAAIVITCAGAQAASAQPGMTPTWSERYHLLSHEERDLLRRGEISDERYVGGGLVGTFFAFGIGHAVQGRFMDKGWIFTVGEAASVAILVAVMTRCYRYTFEETHADDCDAYAGWMAVGLVGALGFRIWELVDLWAGPPAHNARVRAVRMRAGLPPYGMFAAPPLGRGDSGGVAGLTLRF